MIRLIRTAMALPGVDRLAAELRFAPPDWRARQDARIGDIVRHAYRRTRYYRRSWDEAGIDPGSVQGAADLAALPVVPQMEWRLAPPEEMLAAGLRGPLLWSHTGGTTGPPLHLPYTLRDDAAMTAGMLAVLRRNGARWRDLMRLSPPLPPIKAPVRRVGSLVYLGRHLSQADMLAILESGRFPLVRCIPGPTWRAVVQARREGRRLPPIRLLISGAEVLTGAVRRTLAEALSARVVNHYGTTDFGHVATECAAGRLHVFWHTVHVEILQGDCPAAPGEAGEVVITGFVSHGRPVVRVRTGDWAAWSAELCPCGNPAPVLDYMAGRQIDRIFTPDGRAITWPAVDNALKPLGDNLLGFQAEAVTRDRVTVRLSLAAQPTSLDETRLSLQSLLGGLAWDVEFTDDFRAEPRGKTRPVIGFAG